MIKILLWEFNLYWEFMCADKNNDKNKKNLHPPSPVPSSTPVTVYLIAEKLLSLWAWNVKTCSLFWLPVLWKIKCDCMCGLFF